MKKKIKMANWYCNNKNTSMQNGSKMYSIQLATYADDDKNKSLPVDYLNIQTKDKDAFDDFEEGAEYKFVKA